MAKVRVAFSSKNFTSGQNVEFKIYDNNENLIFTGLGNEWSNTGVYYLQTDLNVNGQRTYLVIAEELYGHWKDCKLITKQNKI